MAVFQRAEEETSHHYIHPQLGTQTRMIWLCYSSVPSALFKVWPRSEPYPASFNNFLHIIQILSQTTCQQMSSARVNSASMCMAKHSTSHHAGLILLNITHAQLCKLMLAAVPPCCADVLHGWHPLRYLLDVFEEEGIQQPVQPGGWHPGLSAAGRVGYVGWQPVCVRWTHGTAR